MLGFAIASGLTAMLSINDAYQLVTNDERERSFLITDPRQQDNPIVFANDAFCRLTGYTREEVLGGNCRFLQGKDTNPRTVRAIREAIAAGRPITADILNYTKTGVAFWNRLRIRPTRAANGEIDAFVGLQNPIEPSEVRDSDGLDGRRARRL